MAERRKKRQSIPVNPGDRFGRLVVLKELGPRRYNSGVSYRAVQCQCDCGKVVCTAIGRLEYGRARSCGCLQRESAAKSAPNKTHGMSSHPLQGVLNAIKTRCYNSSHSSYKRYGGRGIGVCDEWMNSYEAFIKWGLSHGWEHGMQIDRIDNDGNYTPENCRMVTPKRNSRNKSNSILIEYNGVTKHIMDWSDETGFSYSTLFRRIILYRWSIDRAFTTPVATRRRKASA